MRRKALATIILSVIVLTAISSIVFVKISMAGDAASSGLDISSESEISSGSAADIDIKNHDFTYIPPTLETPSDNALEGMAELGTDIFDEPFVPATEIDLDPESITVFVNKEHELPKSYKPTDLVQVNIKFHLETYDDRTYLREEAADALEKLFVAAEKDGYILYGVSGYRSYERQYKIFTNNIVKQGKTHTLRYSAVPGTSEHQTGLAIDVSTESLKYRLTSDFASSKEGMWLSENAHYYGYIIRYPEGKAEVTGYYYEPWHIRYVGRALANYLYNNQMTLDEYYQYIPSKNFDFEEKYADLINYKPPYSTPIPKEEDDVILGENGEIIDGETGDVTEDEDQITEDEKDDTASEDNITDIPKKPTNAPEEEENTSEDNQPEDEDSSSTPEEPGDVDTDVTPVPTPAVEDDITQEATPTPTVIPAN